MFCIYKEKFWLVLQINDREKKQLFFKIKIFSIFPFIIVVRSFPPVAKNVGIVKSHKLWLMKIKNYPSRSSTLLTSIKDGAKKRLQHPLS